jgi:hypothetical protein
VRRLNGGAGEGCRLVAIGVDGRASEMRKDDAKLMAATLGPKGGRKQLAPESLHGGWSGRQMERLASGSEKAPAQRLAHGRAKEDHRKAAARPDSGGNHPGEAGCEHEKAMAMGNGREDIFPRRAPQRIRQTVWARTWGWLPTL